MLEPLLLSTALLTSAIFGWDLGGRTIGTGSVVASIGASDGSAGGLVCWLKNSDFAAQRITSAGVPAPGWPAGGRIVAGTTFSEYPAGVAAGAAGDGFFLWYRSVVGGNQFRLAHTNASGAIDPLWPADGLGVAAAPLNAQFPLIVPDGTGGVLVSWQEGVINSPAFSTRTARLMRILANGTSAPGWPAQGLFIAAGIAIAEIREIVPDGIGGYVVAWLQYDPSIGNLAMAQRIMADGTIAPGWPATGVRVCTTNANQILASAGCAIADGSGGVYIAWDDDREDPLASGSYGDIYMTRLNPDGTRPAGWPVTGLPIHVAPSAQWDARLCPDGDGGALVVWTDRSNRKARMSRVTPSGAFAPGWGVGGNLVCNAPGTAENPRLCTDGAGGAYVGWSNYTGDYHAIAQHMRGDGTLAPGWTLAGAPLVDLAEFHDEQFVSIFPSTPGTAIMTWSDCRDSQTPYCGTIRAQRLVTEGLVPTQLALQSAEADAERVRLTWWGVGAAEAVLMVERSGDGEAWRALGAATATSGEQVSYEDRDIHAGEHLAYRLVDGSGRVLVAAAWVQVPQRLEFALAGARPNPARLGALTVELSLAAQGSGTLELLDLAGRRVAWRELGSLAPGRHTLPFRETASLAPGMHWLRLRQGAAVRTTGVVLTR